MGEDRWWIDEEWKPSTGAHRAEALGAMWGPVACGEHSAQIEDNDSTHELVGDGFQPDCAECARVAENTRQHVSQVERSNG